MVVKNYNLYFSYEITYTFIYIQIMFTTAFIGNYSITHHL